MPSKNNSFIENLTRKIERKYQIQLGVASELDAIAMMKTVNEELGVGPGRAENVFFAYQQNREDLAKTFISDYGPDKNNGDKNMLHTKYTYSKFLKRVFGEAAWENVKTFFVILRDYW